MDPYGSAHQRVRERLMRKLRRHPGQPCGRCGLPMYPFNVPGEGIDLGHSEAWMKLAGLPGDRLEHARCNRSYQDGTKPAHLVNEWTSVVW
jgi:hypothetical protein